MALTELERELLIAFERSHTDYEQGRREFESACADLRSWFERSWAEVQASRAETEALRRQVESLFGQVSALAERLSR